MQEWIPVYGYINKALSIKRELKAVELGRLRQRIFLLENEVKQVSPEERNVVLPRLINAYLWLIDKYSLPPIEQSKIDEILLKIKILDATIYKAIVS